MPNRILIIESEATIRANGMPPAIKLIKRASMRTRAGLKAMLSTIISKSSFLEGYKIRKKQYPGRIKRKTEPTVHRRGARLEDSDMRLIAITVPTVIPITSQNQ